MKVRRDFVTNSSSSSFIIAKHKDCTKDEVKTMLYGIKDNIKSLIYNCDGVFECAHEKEIEDAYRNDKIDEAIEFIIEDLTAKLLWGGYGDGLTLDDWSVHSAYASSEDPNLFSCALYDIGHLMNTKHLKLEGN